MSNTKKYWVTLSPLGKFFFGGDMTFTVGSEKEKQGHNEYYSSYMIESNKFPQQTSLLGMMRYYLLTKNPEVFDNQSQTIKDTKKEQVKQLIGEHSFSVVDEHKSLNSFGKILSLGPCFLVRNGEVFLPASKDYGFEVKFDRSQKNGDNLYNGKEFWVPQIEGFDPKKEQKQMYVGLTGKNIKEESDIFVEDLRVGINKSYDGKSDGKGFYKQVSYRLADGFGFAFVCELKDYELTDCQHEIVSLGADGSKFMMSAVEISDDKMDIPDECAGESLLITVNKTDVSKLPRVILLSDSLLTQDIVDMSIYSIAEQVPFRFLRSCIDVKNYTILSSEVKRCDKYYLYQKGSVFYFETLEQASKFQDAVEGIKEFYQIGYNYCKIK